MGLACIDVEKVISGHSWFAWHTSRNDYKMAVIQCIGELFWSKVTCNLFKPTMHGCHCTCLYVLCTASMQEE